jgi:predicted dinucleotide-binding enzyme
MSDVIVVIGAGQIGQAIARRVSAGQARPARRPASRQCRRGG